MLVNMAEHCEWYLLDVKTMAQKRSGDDFLSSERDNEVSNTSSCRM